MNNINNSEYIIHHLQHYSNKYQDKIINLSILNIDTIFLSLFCGILIIIFLFVIIKKISLKNPNRFQLFIEILIELIINQYKLIINKKYNFILPLCFIMFNWIFFMNILDILPLNFIIKLINYYLNLNIYYHLVPTSDLNCTLGLSIGIFFITLYSYIKNKKKKFLNYIFCHPFGIILFPFNFILNIIELISKFFSLGMRLFGNMYTGELIFLLIFLLSLKKNFLMYFFSFMIGSIWSIFHIFIILLQAIIFIILIFIYINQTYK